ncbi:MAG TPA: glycoside hydrolase family 3 C-terminal domain-containing protein [Ohtaekwangia sp.]|nr:glycoside hydrolase family 3 C-terminal domain-containing protein [Ohtaekwangia sp.]
MRRKFLSVLLSVLVQTAVCAQEDPLFRNSDASIEQRIRDLLSRATPAEKIALFGYNSPGIARLGIPPYNWWNEALHGVARAGEATVFPQAIALAATFNDSLMLRIAGAISTEARAKYNLASRQGRRTQYMGLTFWSPNINIFRDPRWGRGQETYGEDPYLTSRMGSSFVRGMQGSDPRYLKTSACAKHLAVHSGPEATRHTFNAVVDEKDLRETYLYAFHTLANAGVESIMCGYNRVNGEPCCTGKTLLHNIVRDEWKFKGHLVTDCWALEDIWLRHKVLDNAVVVAAEAVKVGINVDCSNLMQDNLQAALDQKLITMDDIDRALMPALRTQFKLGFYDDPESVPYHMLAEDDVHSQQHVALARQAAQQSMVLLKNNKGVLPLKAGAVNSILVTGANSASMDAMVANYHGVSADIVTFVEGITAAAGPAMGVQYDLGCNDSDTVRFGGLWASENSDVTIAVLGLTPVLEGEAGDAFLAAHGGDKKDLSIPAAHEAFLKALRQKHQKPIIAVLTSGSAIDIEALSPYADAIILAWYPGEQGGHALADILFGNVSPSGRLPLTFYKSLDDLPPYENYEMKGRTYRYFKGKTQYPFGYGLSYTTFSYAWKQLPLKKYAGKDTLSVTITIKNTGAFAADEVAQAYVIYPEQDRMPLKELKQFRRVSIEANGAQDITLKIPIADLRKWNTKKGKWELPQGEYTLFVGGHSEDVRIRTAFRL